jgi:hypothetical protein
MPEAKARKRSVAALAAALALTLAGCAAPDGVGGYFVARGSDFADMWRLSLGPALGLHARVRAVVLHAGEGFSVGRDYGWDGSAGASAPRWRRLSYTLWAPVVWLHDVDVRGLDPDADWAPYLRVRLNEKRPPRDMEPAEVIRIQTRAVLLGYRYRSKERDVPHWTEVADYYWVSAEATPLVLTVRAGINPVELLDWLGGLFCLDLLGDDGSEAPPETAPPDAAPASASSRRELGRS